MNKIHLLSFLMLFGILYGFGQPWIIGTSLQDNTWDGQHSTHTVSPGDKIYIAGDNETRQPLKIINVIGTQTQPVIITTVCTGNPCTYEDLTIIASSSDNWGIKFENCKHFVLRGHYSSSTGYGLQIDLTVGDIDECNGVNTSFKCSDFTIERIEIYSDFTINSNATNDEEVQNGILSNAYALSSDENSWGVNDKPGVDEHHQENVVIKNCYIHDINGNAIVIGSDDFAIDITHSSYTFHDPEIKNVEIFFNSLIDIGENGIKLYSATGNEHSVFENVIENTCLQGLDEEGSGIRIENGCRNVDVYNNRIKQAKGNGIKLLPYDNVDVFNNIIVNSGWKSGSGGIYFAAPNTLNLYYSDLINVNGALFRALNNAVILPQNDGIKVKAGNPATIYITNNIVVKEEPINGNVMIFFEGGQASNWYESNNLLSNNNVIGTYVGSYSTATISDIFVSSNNYKLKFGSPAFNSGNPNYNTGISKDFEGTNRIKAGIIDQGPYENLKGSWPYQATVWSALCVVDENLSLNRGDILGAFFRNDSGYHVCGGYMKWEGQTDTLVVFEEHGDTAGFSNGDDYIWIVWDSIRGEEHIYNVDYDNEYPQTDTYQRNGLSKLIDLYDEQTIVLDSGWNIFSTYIDPQNDSIHNILEGIKQNVEIVEDYDNSYDPDQTTNTLVTIEAGKAYKIQMNTDDTLVIRGFDLRPEETPIPLDSSWNLLGYLLKTTEEIEPLLENIISNVTLVKDENAIIYWPAFNINYLENMIPGEGYEAQMIAIDTLLYPSNYIASNSKATQYIPKPKYFKCNIRTNNNLSLGILNSAWEYPPMFGDEIAVFDSEDNLVGSSVYLGGNLAITVWGSDGINPEKAGLEYGEKFSLKLYHIADGSIEELEFDNWLMGNNYYKANEVCIVDKIQRPEEASNLLYLGNCYPNPAMDISNIDVYLSEETTFKLQISNLYGEIISEREFKNLSAGNHTLQINCAKLNSGIYLYSISNSNFKETKLMSIIK